LKYWRRSHHRHKLRLIYRPRCRALGTRRGGSGIFVDDELARAIRCESATAIRHWWGASHGTVAWWRRVLDVTSTNNDSSHRLVHDAAKAGAAAMREREVTEEEGDARGERANRAGC
jgi:hypothetical protein